MDQPTEEKNDAKTSAASPNLQFRGRTGSALQQQEVLTMVKNALRLLALTLILAASVGAASAATTCTRETGWTDASGHPLDCYTCGSGSQQATYCYPAR